MSTLDQADVDVMLATKTCVAAHRFQYDYLNDDITHDGKIDYTLTNKIPEQLRKAIAEGKKILVLINPPYGESGAGIGKGDKNKKEVEQTKVNSLMKTLALGYASKELFVQFMVRIAKEIPTATVAMFSTMKYVNAPNFQAFRKEWNAKYLGGFVVHSKAFDGLNGNFPIGFLLWKTNQNSTTKTPITEISVEVLDKKVNPIGEKYFYNLPNNVFLNAWFDRPQTNNELALPLSNAIKVSSNPRLKKSCDGMVGFFYASNNDFQHAALETLISSSIFTGGNGGGWYITPDNLWQVAVMYTVRRVIKPTWLNDRDQFLQPNQTLSDEFRTDCLLWMLFNGSNLTASANDLEWNGKNWSIVNHFIPFTEQEVNASGRFESDFMVEYLKDKNLSVEAQTVLDEGKKLWQAYFAHTDVRSVRDELKLNRPDVGWYQIRKALEARNTSGDFPPVDFKPFQESYKALTEKLRPMVYELGFLKV
jgi:hypothetical protein